MNKILRNENYNNNNYHNFPNNNNVIIQNNKNMNKVKYLYNLVNNNQKSNNSNQIENDENIFPERIIFKKSKNKISFKKNINLQKRLREKKGKKKNISGQYLFSTKKSNRKWDEGFTVYVNEDMKLIPNDILLKIFKMLEVDDLISCVYVCSVWYNLLKDREFWNQYYQFQNKNFFIVNKSWGYYPKERWRIKCTMRKRVLERIREVLCERIILKFSKNEIEYIPDNINKNEFLQNCLKMAKLWGKDSNNKICEYYFMDGKMGYSGYICGIYCEVILQNNGNFKVMIDDGKEGFENGLSISFVDDLNCRFNGLKI